MDYASERLVRDVLIGRVSDQHVGTVTRVVPELDLCQAQARIDLAAINGRISGWEIKTGADSLSRLPRQIPVYGRVFDRVWLVAAERHLIAADRLIPWWWGVLRIDGDSSACRLVEVRRSRLNPHVEVDSLVRLLWRGEVLEELTELGASEGLKRAAARSVGGVSGHRPGAPVATTTAASSSGSAYRPPRVAS